MINYRMMENTIIYHRSCRFLPILAVAVILAGLGACNKGLDTPLLAVSNGQPDTASDIRTTLANSPYHLFYQAYNLVKLDSSYGYYTIFAPTDSVMTAAGLTSTVINSLPVDSLYRFVSFQVGINSYSDSTLMALTLPQLIPTLREDAFVIIEPNSNGQLEGVTYQQNLFVQEKNQLYVNGVPSNNGETPLRARNGYIYPVNRIFTAPDSNVWALMLTKPELSMYTTAIQLIDSFYAATGFYIVTPNAALFQTVDWQVNGGFTIGAPGIFFTIFAPTNDAFAKAGFQTVDDVRQYITSTVPYATDVVYNGNEYYLQYYNPMDSVLKQHYLYTQGANPLFYPDLLNPAINNGWQNTNQWTTGSFAVWPAITPYYTQFSNVGGTVHMQWSRNPAIPAAVLPTTAPAYQAMNGIVYEIDQLFYPHN